MSAVLNRAMLTFEVGATLGERLMSELVKLLAGPAVLYAMHHHCRLATPAASTTASVPALP
jgi:hypothetical protein